MLDISRWAGSVNVSSLADVQLWRAQPLVLHVGNCAFYSISLCFYMLCVCVCVWAWLSLWQTLSSSDRVCECVCLMFELSTRDGISSLWLLSVRLCKSVIFHHHMERQSTKAESCTEFNTTECVSVYVCVCALLNLMGVFLCLCLILFSRFDSSDVWLQLQTLFPAYIYFMCRIFRSKFVLFQ